MLQNTSKTWRLSATALLAPPRSRMSVCDCWGTPRHQTLSGCSNQLLLYHGSATSLTLGTIHLKLINSNKVFLKLINSNSNKVFRSNFALMIFRIMKLGLLLPSSCPSYLRPLPGANCDYHLLFNCIFILMVLSLQYWCCNCHRMIVGNSQKQSVSWEEVMHPTV